MPNLLSWRWAQYAPSIGDNKTLERPFYLRIKADLPKEQLAAFFDALAKAGSAEDWHAVFDGIVELGDEPLTLDGREVTDLRTYLDAVALTPYLMELVGAIRHHNSLDGARASFSERLSGIGPSTLYGYRAAAPSTSGSVTSPS